MSKLEDKAVDLLDKMDQLLTQYTPELLQTALDVVQISGINDILSSSLFILGTLVTGLLLYKYKLNIKKQIKIDDGREFPIIMGIAAYMFILIGAVVIFFSLLDIWKWIAVFNPKLALAHHVLGL